MVDAGENCSSSSAECLVTSLISKRKKSKNKRRFSEEQIRLLENMFENETKLEPKKKLQLARELGLQPRQVAIWFQNKRARWKSKQLERDYNLLHSNYDRLASQFESLKKEKHSLLVQLQKLNDLIQKSDRERGQLQDQWRCGRETSDAEPGNSNIGPTPSTDQFDVKPSLCLERSEYRLVDDDDHVFSDDESSRNPNYFGLDQEPAAGSCLTSGSVGEWGSLDSDVLLEKPSSSCQWWDFWSSS
ncbi:hypothetical protein ACH5RR_000033 [Cinchona calisaya]|uniref:Homeobox-leucine zipper protein n=1 Tax=Cinchona calisaya TaxID=153742 RepID=A0ABD3B0G5_9GENT